MSYKAHAEREFKAMGYDPIDECEDGPNKWMQEGTMELLEVFSKQGHSGSSAPHAIALFKKLAAFEPLCPVQGTDDEWNDVSSFGGGKIHYQNNRCSALFKEADGTCHYNDGIVFKGEDDYDTFIGSVEDIKSSQEVKFPFTPKTFYINVRREKYDIKKHFNDEQVVSCGTGDYVYFIKDRSELDAVWDYYVKLGALTLATKSLYFSISITK